MRSVTCPVCQSGISALHAHVDGYPYFSCGHCDSIRIDPAVIDLLDVRFLGERFGGQRLCNLTSWSRTKHSSILNLIEYSSLSAICQAHAYNFMVQKRS